MLRTMCTPNNAEKTASKFIRRASPLCSRSFSLNCSQTRMISWWILLRDQTLQALWQRACTAAGLQVKLSRNTSRPARTDLRNLKSRLIRTRWHCSRYFAFVGQFRYGNFFGALRSVDKQFLFFIYTPRQVSGLCFRQRTDQLYRAIHSIQHHRSTTLLAGRSSYGPGKLLEEFTSIGAGRYRRSWKGS